MRRQIMLLIGALCLSSCYTTYVDRSFYYDVAHIAQEHTSHCITRHLNELATKSVEHWDVELYQAVAVECNMLYLDKQESK